ncbi:MAG TPA: M10 family metallopeptidase C-terminal domain-containing protein, partial [Pirellulaceae bacterium]
MVDLTDGFELAFHTNRAVYTDEPEQAENLENIIGGAGNDNLKGNLRRNRIEGRGGKDHIDGLQHDDLLEGGDGSDTILGGVHDDTLIGGNGGDTLDGQSGNDVYLFAPAPALEVDFLTEALNGGVDRLDFSLLPAAQPVSVDLSGPLLVLASHQNRLVVPNGFGLAGFFENATGGAGDDVLAGNDVDNALVGGPGNDRYVFGAPPPVPRTDTLTELPGGGTDTLDFSALTATQPVAVDLATAASLAQYGNQSVKSVVGQAEQFENAIGGAGQDILRGNGAANRLEGRGGSDLLNGRAGNDHELGGAGDDQYVFDPATIAENDTVAELVNEGLDLLEFSALAVAITADLTKSLPDFIVSHALRTVVTAAAGQALNFERVFGGTVNDDLRGNAADNWLQGGPGDDRLEGRGGSDRYLFGPGFGPGSLGSDRVIEAPGCVNKDVLDFLQMTSPIIVDLGNAAPQTVDLGGELELTLSHSTSIEQADVNPLFQPIVVRRNGCQLPNWQSVGPNGVIGGQVEGIANQPVAGAVHAIALDPTNSSIAYIGTVNGGVWKTTNALAANPTWRPTSDGFPLSIGGLDIDPGNVNAIVAGIGRFSSAGRDGGRLPGVLKSTNGGNSWELLSTGINGQNV